MHNLRRIYRLLSLCLHTLVGVVLTLLFTRAKQVEPTPFFDTIACWWRARIGRILGLDISVAGDPIPGPALWVSNHISWIDIAVLGSQFPVSFLSKSEVRHWPVLGWLAARAGTLFIQRGIQGGAHVATEEITWHLIRGRRVILFAEGTTTRGDQVRPFHPRLFASAIRAEVPIQPIALRYSPAGEKAQGPVSPHPTVPFVDNDTLLAHLWRVLGESRIGVHLAFLPILSTKATPERKQLAQTTREVVRKSLFGSLDPFGQTSPGDRA